MYLVNLTFIFRYIIHFTNNKAKGFTLGTVAFKIVFCCQNRTILPPQDSLLWHPLIPSLWTSNHKVCIGDKQEQAAQIPLTQGQCLSLTLTNLTILHTTQAGWTLTYLSGWTQWFYKCISTWYWYQHASALCRCWIIRLLKGGEWQTESWLLAAAHQPRYLCLVYGHK